MPERDINAQSLRKLDHLNRLLDSGDQNRYEAELEHIRNRRKGASKQKRQREVARNYSEAVEQHIEQSDYDPSFDD